jgi:hypothetical protein
MSFVYNSKLPFYAWGHPDDTGNSSVPQGPSYQQRSGFVHLAVPLDKSGARKSWNNASGAPRGIASTAPLENVPCDAQMPWKKFATGTFNANFGLTIHGELYQVDCFYYMWFVATRPITSSRPFVGHSRISRWSFSAVNKPIANIFNSSPFAWNIRTTTSLDYYHPAVLAVDTDGAAWWLTDVFNTVRDAFVTNTMGDGAVSIPLPSGKTAKFLNCCNFVYRTINSAQSTGTMLVLTTSDDKTYVWPVYTQNSHVLPGTADWYSLTGGCVSVVEPTDLSGFGWDIDMTLPTVTVSAPGAGGTTATVEPYATPGNPSQWRSFFSKTVNGVQKTYGVPFFWITNPGSGYVSDATLTFSRAPDDGILPSDFQLKAWTDYVVSEDPGSLNGSHRFFDNLGKTVSITPPLLPRPSGYFANVSWITSNFETLVKNTGADSVGVAVKQHASNFPNNSQANQVRFFIGQDEKLYRYNNNPGAGKDAGFEVLDDGPWASLCCSGRTFCGVKRDGTMYTWGVNGTGSGGATANYNRVFFGDGSEVNASRDTPTRIAADADWVSAWRVSDYGFIAIRKDAICRDIDQPMEYWPDWHFGG